MSIVPEVAPTPAQPKLTKTGEALGTGRRKTAVARVRIRKGNGQITINGRPLDEYFDSLRDRQDVLACLQATEHEQKVDVVVRVQGGGPTGQAGAIKLGIARAMKNFDPMSEPVLRQEHLLTRDGRMKERKKYGLRGARRGTQFSKR
ncbi:MAG: 30S ribosomal protein S9 [Pirellulales bacterium]|nr:30S ribosomal protein S9 [Pirellulales bacterium]